MKFALEYLDEDANVTVTEIEEDGTVLTWIPDISTKEFSGRNVYVSLCLGSSKTVNNDGTLFEYRGMGYLAPMDVDGQAYETVEELLEDPADTYADIKEMFARTIKEEIKRGTVLC